MKQEEEEWKKTTHLTNYGAPEFEIQKHKFQYQETRLCSKSLFLVQDPEEISAEIDNHKTDLKEIGWEGCD
jgi:hypothetical protein